MLAKSSSSISINKTSSNMVRFFVLFFEKKSGPYMPLGQYLHQTVTRFGCIVFSMNACGCSVAQIRLLCLFTHGSDGDSLLSKSVFNYRTNSATFPSLSNQCRNFFLALLKRINNHIPCAEG